MYFPYLLFLFPRPLVPAAIHDDEIGGRDLACLRASLLTLKRQLVEQVIFTPRESQIKFPYPSSNWPRGRIYLICKTPAGYMSDQAPPGWLLSPRLPLSHQGRREGRGWYWQDVHCILVILVRISRSVCSGWGRRSTCQSEHPLENNCVILFRYFIFKKKEEFFGTCLRLWRGNDGLCLVVFNKLQTELFSTQRVSRQRALSGFPNWSLHIFSSLKSHKTRELHKASYSTDLDLLSLFICIFPEKLLERVRYYSFISYKSLEKY